LAHEAARQGREVLFVDTHRMLLHINGGRADGTHQQRLARYLKPDLLILDDFGLRPLRPPAPEDLYDVIAGRYEAKSTALTSNRAPEEWPDLFGDPLLAAAALDRLGDHAEVVIMTGASLRAQAARRAGKEEPVVATATAQ
jgi:DNA replication protein DnaC